MDQDRTTELINKSEITNLVNSYFRAIEEKNFDPQHFASIFTPQAKVTRPNGASMIGPEEISASHAKSFIRFEGSQHFVAGHDISLDGSTANIRANLIAMHMWQGSKTDANKLDNFWRVCGGRSERPGEERAWPNNADAAERLTAALIFPGARESLAYGRGATRWAIAR